MATRTPEERKKYSLMMQRRRHELRMVIDLVKDRPCEQCGGRFPPEAMDFDHVRGKARDIARMMWSGQGLTAIIAEIRKCEIVCSNCHRTRTRRRRAGRLRAERVQPRLFGGVDSHEHHSGGDSRA